MALLKHFKRPSVADPERLFRELEAECGVPRPAAGSARSFMSWDEAREMLKAGMSFGSHGHAHEILGRLTYGRQLEDLKTSRRILEKELGAPVVALAYPDGQPGTFNADTFRAAADAGFTTAFSYYSGVNVLGAIRPLDVLRGGVDGAERPSFRLRVALRAATRRELF
jgi:peptidoglycan/xylan/chitin deacetylase (PgdA/CDA1 family)